MGRRWSMRLREGAGRMIALAIGGVLVLAGTAVAVGLGLQNPGFDQGGLTGWTVKVDRPAGNGVPGDNEGKPNREAVYGAGGTKGAVVPCEPGDRYGVCLISGNDVFTTTSGVTKTIEPRSANNMVRIGGPFLNPFQTQKDNHSFVVEQTFTVDSANPLLKLRHKLMTFDAGHFFGDRHGGHDNLTVSLLHEGEVVRERRAYSSANAGEGKRLVGYRWNAVRLNLVPYVGEDVTVRVSLTGALDRQRGTWAYIDPSVHTVPENELNVTVGGAGTGTVTGPGINCPGDCSESYPRNLQVTLNANPTGGSAFGGFEGACGGQQCLLQMDGTKTVSATFHAPPLRDTIAPEVSLQGPSGKKKVKRGKKPRYTYTFTSDEPNTSFTCKLDSAPEKPCTSPYRTPKLKPGTHVLVVRGTDQAGNADTAQRTVRIVAAKKKRK